MTPSKIIIFEDEPIISNQIRQWNDDIQSLSLTAGVSAETLIAIKQAKLCIISIDQQSGKKVAALLGLVKKQGPNTKMLGVINERISISDFQQLKALGMDDMMDFTTSTEVWRRKLTGLTRPKRSVWNWFRHFMTQKKALRMPAPVTRPEDAKKAISAKEEINTLSNESNAEQSTKNEVDIIQVQFFGSFKVWVNGEMLSLNGPRVLSLLAYLILHRERAIPRHRVLDRFWENHDEERAKSCLNYAIWKIRSAFRALLPDQNVITLNNLLYGIAPELNIITDIDEFRKCYHNGLQFEKQGHTEAAVAAYLEAHDYYRDTFLVEMEVEEWTGPERDTLQTLFLQILQRLSDYYLSQEAFQKAITYAQKALKNDNLLENMHQNIIISQYQLGALHLAREQFFKCKAILKKELDTNPSNQTLQWLELTERRLKGGL